MHVYERVLRYIDDPAGDDFGAIALACFEHQFSSIEPYRAVCARRGVTPANVSDWREIPAVPTLAFKVAGLCAGTPERTFLTTGTTQGTAQRGRHSMPHLDLYRRSAIAGMRKFLLPDVQRIRMLSLVHSAAERPESSLGQMVDWAFEAFRSDGETYISGDRIDADGLADALHRSELDGEPVCLMTTTGALIRFLDHCEARNVRFRLSHGSRLMDTGGNKGAPRVLSQKGLLHAIWDRFAIPGYLVVNEYGMTEMSSQFYDNVLRDRCAGLFSRRMKTGPHWVKTRVLDPATLAEMPPGDIGVLCHADLANAGSALVVLTEDLGRLTESGFEMRGRVSGAEARGCSLALAEFEAAKAES